jgi:hypothetical protein
MISKKTYLLTSIAAVVLVEILARLFGFGHPTLYQSSAAGYEPRPNQNIVRMGKQAHYNSFGMRGRETTQLPTTETFRILTVGDSVNNGGSQVNDEETYPGQLERILISHGNNIEVLNASAGGWAIQNAYRWILTHGTFGASTVLLEINEKDLDQEFSQSSIVDRNASFPSSNPQFALQEIFTRYVLPKLGLRISADAGTAEKNYFNKRVAKEVVDTINALKTLTTKSQSNLVILYCDPPDERASVAVRTARDQLFSFAESRGISIIRPKLQSGVPWDQRLFRDGIHPNSYGNRVIAETVAARINLVHIDKVERPKGP